MFRIAEGAFRFAAVACVTMFLGACASSEPVATTQSGQPIYDPLEGVNRAVYSFNRGVDNVIFDPVTEAYRFVVPDAGRQGVNNFLQNLKSPVYLVNEVLQGDFEDAGTVVFRFFVNTLAGIGGILDVASWEGIDYVPEDFGQTLAVWGVDAGPYVVWPLMGPSTMRDSTGFAVDMAADPLTWVLMDAEQDALMYTRSGLSLLNTKDRVMDLVNDLEENSLDPYAAMRSVYFQRREAVINDLDPEASMASPEMDDFDDIE